MHNYTQMEIYVQDTIQDFTNCLHFPNDLTGFVQTSVETGETVSGHPGISIEGYIESTDEDRICPDCGKRMHKNMCYKVVLRHVPLGGTYVEIVIRVIQFECPHCHATRTQDIPFKSEHHRITKQLEAYVEELLSTQKYTNKSIAEMTGLGQGTVKSIDKARLKRLYTEDGKLKKPDKYSKFLAIDEFKLHNGHKYATHIIDLETGHVLWIMEGKKKKVVYDFIDFVGEEWMDHVVAVACDMNSDFQEAFEERCEHIIIIFDHFHIVKNFNEKVIDEVRKECVRQLKKEGHIDEAKEIKGTKYLLYSNKDTLKKKDQLVADGAIHHKGSDIFNIPETLKKGDYVSRYMTLMSSNQPMFQLDIVKTMLQEAYKQSNEDVMSNIVKDMIEFCKCTENEHFLWFARLLENHFEGIIAHASIPVTSSRIEGINNRIKTLRRMGYGYPDDEYFFLKIIDASRNTYVRNPKSHKISH